MGTLTCENCKATAPDDSGHRRRFKARHPDKCRDFGFKTRALQQEREARERLKQEMADSGLRSELKELETLPKRYK